MGKTAGFLSSVSILALGLAGASAAGLPSNGRFASGKGAIQTSGTSLTVKQSTTTGIIDWNSFSIGKKHGVSFNNGSGATLNRVTGGNLSIIAGSLKSTGSLYLMNSQGVVISGSGKVVTGGNFVATSGNISGTGDTRFKPGAGKIVNRGTIIASGATLSGSDVTETGTIRAAQIDLTAQHELDIDGAINARKADGIGGTIIARGRHIAVGRHASVTASGSEGGTVLIGGDIHGGRIEADNFVKQNVRTAQSTAVAAGAHISADGSKSAGGNIVIWSDGHTSFAGQLSAEGQTDGGFAEVSSHDLLGFTGRVDLTSTRGAKGTLLLDPENVVIKDGTTSGGSLSGGKFTPSGDDSVLSVADLEAALASANIVVTTGSRGLQTGDITVIDPVTWSSNSKLTLDAYHSVIIGAPITITGGGSLTLTTNDGGMNGTLTFVKGLGSVEFSNLSSALTINNQSYILVDSISDLASDIATTPAGNFALASTIQAGATTFATSPIPTTFTGIFEGLGNTISHLKIDDTTDTNVGFFADIDTGGSVSDLQFVSPTIKGTVDGSVVGVLSSVNNGAVHSVVVSGGSVGGNAYIGGLIGASYGGEVIDFDSTASVSGGDQIGGLLGQNGGDVENDYATGMVTSNNGAAGGLIGVNLESGTVENVYATGKVYGAYDAGGLIAGNSGSVDSSHATGNVSGGDYSYVGGLFGDQAPQTSPGPVPSTTNSWASGNVSGGYESFVGGFVGEHGPEGTIASSHSTGSVTGGDGSYVGGFAGDNSYSASGIMESYATGNAKAGSNSKVGGFVGYNYSGGTIATSFSTGISNGGSNSSVGGFVGYNDGALSEDYSLGGVIGASPADAGGFVGYNDSTIDQAYATGEINVTAAGASGGFAGSNSGTTTHAYFDSQTIGRSIGVGTGATTGITADTTPQLQSALPSGFSPADWKIVAGKSFPYLAWQAPSGTPQVVSGTLSGPGNVGISVGVLVNGLSATPLAGLATGTNGYYYELLAPGTIASSGSDVLVYTQSGSHANSFDQGATGSLTGFNISPETLKVDSSATSASAMLAAMEMALGSNSGSDFLYTSSGSFTAGSNLYLNLSVSSFTINKVLNVGNGKLIIDAAGGVSEDNAGAIDAATLEGSSVSTAEMNSASNVISDVGAFTSGSTFELTDDNTLVVDGALNAGSHTVELATTGSGHGIAVDSALTGGTVKLTSVGAISESSAGSITATKLEGSSVSTAEMNSASNVISDVGAFTSGSTFELTDDNTLVVDGALNAGSQTVELTTTGSGHGIAVDSGLEAANIYLVSSGAISEDSAGDLDATELTGSSVGAAVLTSASNTIAKLEAFTAGGTFSLTDDASLAVDGAVGSGTASTHLTTVGASHNIGINAAIDAANIYLVSSGAISEDSAGDLDATELTGSSVGAAVLTSTSNTFTDLEGFTTSGNNKFELTDAHTLAVHGAVNVGTGTLDLTTVGSASNLDVYDSITGGTINLLAGAKAMQNSSGAIIASTILNVTANTGIDLTSTKNKIKKLGTDKTNSGTNKVTL